MIITRTYHTLMKKIEHTIPTGHQYRQRNLGWFMTGIYQSQSVHTSKVANKIPGKAKRVSRTRRLSRFLNNSKVNVRQWYYPVAKQLLNEAARTGKIRLIIDATKVASNHQLLMVALAYRRRALPIAWTWVKGSRGHSSGHKQRALLSYVHGLVPEDTTVILSGDSEFAPLQSLLEDWQWYYVLRQKGRYLYHAQVDEEWDRLDSLVSRAGQKKWVPEAQLTQKHQLNCHLLAYWRHGEKHPWLLATNLPTARQTNLEYKPRMWVEEMFGDWKRNGADLESSCLKHFLRLSRLTLVVALLYVWLIAFGSTVIKRGDRHFVDRADRRDLSIYRIGYDMFERCLINNLHISIRDVPYFV